MEVYRMRRLAVFGGPLILIALTCYVLGDGRFNGLDLCATVAAVLFVLLVLLDEVMVRKGRWKS